MKNYLLSPEALINVAGSSKGVQPKFYDNGVWYKKNCSGYEGKAEHIVSLIESCSNIEDYVVYEECRINGDPGCRSKTFLKNNDESFISFARLYNIYTGKELENDMLYYQDISDRVEFVRDFINTHTGLDPSRYLAQICALDCFTMNTDRHFNNLGVIINIETDRYRFAPIFDNGYSLLSDINRFPLGLSIEDNIKNVFSKPFAANPEMQAYYFGFDSLKIDYKKLDSLLMNEDKSRAKQVVLHQIKRYKNIFPTLNIEKEKTNINDSMRENTAVTNEEPIPKEELPAYKNNPFKNRIEKNTKSI